MKQKEKLKRARTFMTKFHRNDYSGHDIAHIHRVERLALYIADREQPVNTFIINMACLLHDTVDSKLTNIDEAAKNLRTFLASLEIEKNECEAILHIINNISYNHAQTHTTMLTKEGQIVRDADRLDALGAIGIARTFQFAGAFNEPMWSNEVDFPSLINGTVNLNDLSPSAIKHFYEKLFNLKDLMHTKTAMTLAKERHNFMQQFVQQFFYEWESSI
ncbi:HD domain-containing protein [Staphylococcus durrellii]|uniref:HD domain-containing protein n=1 Tax=Staphylococcus durrellii TaxID=2781773 RepID=UPI00189E0489|nr:HD domain-containing protein [Staphylococcus durrellii]MBF7016591.1 HD domain-containing protein [Staphylococcus durrellii]